MPYTFYKAFGVLALASASELVVTDVEAIETAASFWLNINKGIMTLFVANIIGNFRDISSLLLLLAIICNCGWSRICFSCGGARLFALSVAALLLFFFSGLFGGLFIFTVLFALANLTLALAFEVTPDFCWVLSGCLSRKLRLISKDCFFLKYSWSR